jgi:aminoglycoside phosphotransferase (APT) family kinase protein
VDDDVDRIVAAISGATGIGLVSPVDIERAPGGYAWETFFVTDATHQLVVRIAPAGGTTEPYIPSREAQAIDAARSTVPAPAVLGYDDGSNLLGRPFSVQSRVAGSILSLRSVPEMEQPAYRQAFAQTLGSLHAGGSVKPMTAEEALGVELEHMMWEYGEVALEPQPGLEAGIRWLQEHLPSSDAPAVLCHGDFRFANIMWSAPGQISGVLDWERSWTGDPMSDIAFTRQFSGWCAVDGDVMEAYEQASGIEVDEERVAYGLRFERVRAYLSPLRLMKAIFEGRVTDPRLIDIAEAGEAGMWELLEIPDIRSQTSDRSISHLAPHISHPAVDWTRGIEDTEIRAHFEAHPRPVCVDPDDPDEVARVAKEWRERPLRKNRRTWN